jgi:signal transduction histidine kinase
LTKPQHALLRVIQESLTNVAKHSQGSRALVRLSLTRDRLHCAVEDDGKGFDLSAARGHGLDGLQERMQAVGGTFEVRSAPGQGTRIIASLPLRA